MLQSYLKKWSLLQNLAVLINVFIIIIASSHISYASDITPQNSIQKLIENQKFEEALSLMAQEDFQTQNSYEHRYLKGRILSWKGDHTQAELLLESLMSEFPGNDDVLLAIGSLDYYQGNLSAAENAFLSILSRTPNRSDALQALENVKKAKKAKRPHKWRIDGGAGLSSFEETDLTDWNNQYLRAEYAPNNIAYHAQVQNYRRFGQNNMQFEGGIADAKRGDWDWGLTSGFTPSSDFRPEFHVGGRIGHKFKLETGPTIVTTLHYRYDQYTDAKIHNISPEVTAYFKNGARLTGRVINSVESEASDQTGWLVNGSYPVSKKWTLNGGYANAPEAVENPAGIGSLVVTTQSVFGGVTYAATPQLDLHINVARDNRQDTYIRNAVNVGFTKKY